MSAFGVKRRSRFPDPRETTVEGIVAAGGDLLPETLIDAYTHGIFPWPQEGMPMLWFSPPERGVIDLSGELKAPSRFLREYSKLIESGSIEVRADTAFDEVIESCRVAARQGQQGTWILGPMVDAYRRLHELDVAHSIEVWEDGELVGGLYGVFLRGVFSGESMFHRRPNRGKIALWALMQKLKAAQLPFLDVQMVTPVVASFGGVLISRDEYLRRLQDAQTRWEKGAWRFEWAKGPWSL
ncbi:MAG: leucyl/phenylalanyl-tRNA--protein transferase [Bdellovibrionales bacterium]|nr:leucyl/phenylalanyl-tRNA--protein transferase [Bdellovibrionales bacterium]